MKSHLWIRIRTGLSIVSNLLMMTVLNQGEPIWPNLVVIAIAFYLLPIYLLATDIKQTSLVVLKSCLYPISFIWNASVITIAVVMGTGLLGLAIARLNK